MADALDPRPALPAPRRPVTLTGIASTAWEHPADRAALNALRALPMFDEIVRKIFGFFGERGIRQLFLANAVRVGPSQRPALYALYEEVLTTLDCPTRPELYVTQTPFANAAAIGLDRPFIVVNSGALDILDRDEQRVVLAHEVGHIMSGHAVYTTLALILVHVGFSNLPFLAGMALLPFQLALFEWQRKAEFSADRAALLGTQDRDASMGLFLKFAGGRADEDRSDLAAFVTQAQEYETGGDAWDTVLKILNTAFRTHPFSTVRVAELQRWIDAGGYDQILRGDYPRRGDQTQRPIGEDFADAAGYYGQQARDAFGTINASLDRARQAFSDAFNKK